MVDNKHNIEVDWLKGRRPFQFFGPCSAESVDQLRITAKGISEHFQDVIFRAGIWKPRTRPNTFEGVGKDGLKWLIDIKEEFGFQVATEVASAAHVDACLNAGIDVLWIGARTTVNPFSVQAIADALKGVDIPVFVKNPINPDVSLWSGAVERIEKAGVSKIGAIHRGFHLSDNRPYRNAPAWELAVQFRTEHIDIPLICDVSHISGVPELIPHVAQRAFDLDMDGLMVETHYKPKEALSDAKQQLTPLQLHELINNLVFKSADSKNAEFKNQLDFLREKIDRIDDQVVELMATRMNISEEIGSYKKENQVTVLQIQRWQEILQRSLKSGEALNLSPKFITSLYNAIHDESIRKQTIILERDGK
ncbi:MAG: bifunctional 3-deoxy-7-phosphoheptulonate synthase/chorismate mutase type II [Flavobacteriales bacterium]|nr:bifunctional 3-deoxy-7-phosphoheptulonate synthase/chorismate mutase type II [Flavobacteriales bacterium]